MITIHNRYFHSIISVLFGYIPPLSAGFYLPVIDTPSLHPTTGCLTIDDPSWFGNNEAVRSRSTMATARSDTLESSSPHCGEMHTIRISCSAAVRLDLSVTESVSIRIQEADPDDDDGVPGFGPIAALIAIGGLLAIVRCRLVATREPNRRTGLFRLEKRLIATAKTDSVYHGTNRVMVGPALTDHRTRRCGYGRNGDEPTSRRKGKQARYRRHSPKPTMTDIRHIGGRLRRW